MKKYLGMIIGVVIIGSSITAAALSNSTSTNLNGDHARAVATLNYTFHNRLFGNDTADASTRFIEKNGNYRVAVRLEGCDSQGNLLGYRYNSSSTEAISGELSFEDVGSFRSRHSIDEFDSNYNYVEVQVSSLYMHE